MRLWIRIREWLREDDGTFAVKGSLVEPRNLATDLLIGGAIMALGGAGWGVWKLVTWLAA